MIAAAECDVLVIGQEYLVPCINGVPVVGEPHVDHDHFNETPVHFHCDSRFMTEPESALRAMHASVPIERGVLKVYDPDERIVPTLEPMVCVREIPAPFPPGKTGIGLMTLYADYGFTTAKCGLCPHKRMPILGGRCSGHRLEWLSDGTIKYKPPYVLRIRGTGNCIRIAERMELTKVEFQIIEPVDTYAMFIDMEDRDGNVFVSQQVDSYHLGIGDRLTYGR